MTEYREVRDDGTRVYKGWAKYKPKAPEERVIGVNRPDDPRAVRFHTRWFLPLDVLPDEDRVRPETRADSDAYDHMTKAKKCKCRVCKRPESEPWKRKWRKDNGIPEKKNRRRRRKRHVERSGPGAGDPAASVRPEPS